MTQTFVLDSSALVALLVDGGTTGDWVASMVTSAALAAPELAMFETANILRRQELAGALERAEATLAHQDLMALPIQLWPYPPLSERVWELRNSLTSYDASYVALAELLGAQLLTLDARLGRANGPTCDIVVPATP